MATSPKWTVMLAAATLTLLRSCVHAVDLKACTKPGNPTGECDCQWLKDETDETTLSGMVRGRTR
jgi:hypothetical protein